MAINTNELQLNFCVEDSEGTLAGTETWYLIEPNDLSDWGASISTVTRNPISQDRMDKKGTISDLDSTTGFTSDFTISEFNNFIDGFLFSTWHEQPKAEYTETDTSSFTHPALSSALAEGDLIYARNSSYTANNGLFVVDSGATTTNTPVTATLSADSSPANGARFDFVGVQGSAGDITMDSDGNLETTTLDFTGYDLYVGQAVYIGGTDTDTSFGTSGKGFGRISNIAANKLSLTKVPDSFGADDGSGKTIQLFFGSFIKNVGLNDSDFQELTYQIEAKYPDLYGTGSDGYQYAIGQRPDSVTFNLPLTDKGTIDWGFVGLDTEEVTDTRVSTSGTQDTEQYDDDALNTTSDFARLTFEDDEGSAVGTYFKSVNLTINNNISPEKVLGQLGAAVMNIGDFNVSISTEVLFTSEIVLNAVRNNETLSLDFAVSNDDGCIYCDIPAMTLGNSNMNLPRNETVKISVDGNLFKSDALGYVLSFTKFAHIPGL